MPITVIYHSADHDGIFCREIARRFLGEKDVEFIGWNYGDPKIEFPKEGTVYILDLSPEAIDGAWDIHRLIWIDHHKTAIERYPEVTPGFRIDGVAACRLTWSWFALMQNWDPREIHPNTCLPTKQEFIDHIPTEPLAVRLAGEYDIWDKRDPRAETFQFGIRLVDIGSDFWEALLSPDAVGEKAVEDTLANGLPIQRYSSRIDASTCKRTWLMKWHGLVFLCLNSARFNSSVFEAKDVPETGHDALMGFCFDGKQWNFSLYHAKHRTDLDLSEIAKIHGGGGHKGACGFRCKELPFPL